MIHSCRDTDQWKSMIAQVIGHDGTCRRRRRKERVPRALGTEEDKEDNNLTTFEICYNRTRAGK